jgi:hypothetical protein
VGAPLLFESRLGNQDHVTGHDFNRAGKRILRPGL